MEDELDAARGGVHALVAAEVAFHELDLIPHVREVGAVAGGEVVEHPHVVAAREQRADEVAADEPAAAGDEHLRHQPTTVPARAAAATPKPIPSHVTPSSGIPEVKPSALHSPITSSTHVRPTSASGGGPRHAIQPATTSHATTRAKPIAPRSASASTYSVCTPYGCPGAGNDCGFWSRNFPRASST